MSKRIGRPKMSKGRDWTERGAIRRVPDWLARVGKPGYAFFMIKGLAWLILPVALWLID